MPRLPCSRALDSCTGPLSLLARRSLSLCFFFSFALFLSLLLLFFTFSALSLLRCFSSLRRRRRRLRASLSSLSLHRPHNFGGPSQCPDDPVVAWQRTEHHFASAAANHKSPALAGRGRGAHSSTRCFTGISVANRFCRAALLWGCRQCRPCNTVQHAHAGLPSSEYRIKLKIPALTSEPTFTAAA